MVISWHSPIGLERGLAGERPADRGHGVGEVEDPGVGTQLLDVAGDVEEHRDVAQRPHDTSGADGVADRLAHAVALRDLEVVTHRVRSHRSRCITTTKSASRSASRRSVVARGREPDTADVGEVLRELDHARQRRGIDVVQHDLGVTHNRGVDEVDEQLRCPLVAAATDDRDARAAMVRSSFDTVRCDTHSARRSLTGQIDVGVVRCWPITNRGDPWAIEEESTPYDVHRVRRHTAARGADVRGDVTFDASVRAARNKASRRTRSRSAFRWSTSKPIKDFVDYEFGDTEAISKVFVDYINDNGGINGRKIVPVYKKYPPIPGGKPDPLSLCTAFAEDDKVFAVLGVFIDFTGQGQQCLTKEHNVDPHRARDRPALDRRVARPALCSRPTAPRSTSPRRSSP